LQSGGLRVAVVTVDSDETAGTVLSQSPNAGSGAARGATVSIDVSNGSGAGSATVNVPNVLSLDEATAVKTLEAAGFTVETVYQRVTEPP
jgi:beta-lactam-binding protein with PASTA domain